MLHPYSTIERTAGLAPEMRLALDLAHEALGQTSPNPTVGCVIARAGTVVGKGGGDCGGNGRGGDRRGGATQ